MSIQDQPLARPGSQIVPPPERAATDAHQAARQGMLCFHVETTEELSDVTDLESSLFASRARPGGHRNGGLDLRPSPG